MNKDKPSMAWIKTYLLQVDSTYQRDATGTRSEILIQQIVKNFNWKDFTPLTVVKIDTGHYNIIDGQHRFIAACKLKIDELPCWIVGEESTKDDAQVFLDINKNRVEVNKYAIYKAKLAIKDPQALKIQQFCNDVGISIPFNGYCSQPNMTLALGCIGQHLQRHNSAYLTEAIHSIVKAYPKTTGQLKKDIINTLVKLKIDYGAKIKNDDVIEALKSFKNVNTITSKARELSALDTSLKPADAHFKVFINKIKELRKGK